MLKMNDLHFRRLGCKAIPALFVVAVGVPLAFAKSNFPAPGEWPCYRGNAALDGHADGRGAIAKPWISWSHRFSLDVATLRVTLPGATPQTVIDGAKGLTPDEQERSLGLRSAPRDRIAGVVQPIEHSDTTTYADILPEVPGLEKVYFQSSFNMPTKDGKWQYAPGQLLAWRDGQWQVEWEMEEVGRTFRANPIVADFDNDGELEIAALPWSDLRIYNARTGQLEHQCKFTKGRSYGFFGAYDLDGDGVWSFVVLADFSKHFEVIGYRDNELQVLWQDEIELEIADPQTVVHVPIEPVGNLDGDGNSEIVTSIFNRQDDGSWHTEIRDSITGKVSADIVDEFAQGVIDLDGDGRDELLTTVTNGQHLPPSGTIRVRTLAPGKSKILWQMNDAAWHAQQAAQGAHWRYNSVPTTFMSRNINNRNDVVVRHAIVGGQQAVSKASWSDDSLKLSHTIASESSLQSLGIDGSGSLIVQVACEPGGEPQVDANGNSVELVDMKPLPQNLLTPPIVIRPSDSDRPLVVVQDTSSSLRLIGIEPSHSGQAAQEKFRLEGRVSHLDGNSPNGSIIETLHASQYGPVAADLTGDGKRQLLVTMGSSTGLATMVALDSTSANAIWRREFERFSAGQERWISGGPTVWHAAHLTTRDRQDVVLTLRRSRMHSEETFALSGESGKTIWHRDKQIADRSFGGQPFAIADYDEDGLEDLASFYTHIRYVTDGATGKDLLAKENYWSEVPISPVYWGQPVAGQFGSALNKNSLLFTTDRRQMIGLVQLDGELAWSDAYDKAANGYPAIGDFDGDQQVEAIFVGFEDGTRCYHLATGDQLWSLPLGANRNVESAVSGDLDGDGLDEAVFALGDTLYCLGFDSTTNRGQVEWSIRLPSTVSSPIIADIQSPGDRSGDRLVVLVCGNDGVVYCIDNAEP